MKDNNDSVSNKEWFEIWFDSPEYHTLYMHRDLTEAGLFIRKLISDIKIKPGSRVLDLACGRGRHTFQLATYPFEVFGLDYSPNNIAYANEHHKYDKIVYFQHDMRDPFPVDNLDLVLNLFTSFGYFREESENIRVLNNVHKSLKNNGIFVLDYFNTSRIIYDMVHEERLFTGGFEFDISRKIEGRHIVKTIRVKSEGQAKYFQERVMAYGYVELKNLIESCGFTVVKTYGDYNLDLYKEGISPRMIFNCRKL